MDLARFAPSQEDLRTFDVAMERTGATLPGTNGIGTLAEKTVHCVLKNWFAPDPGCQEVRIGRNVADARTPEGVIEVQTRQFYRLRPKLRDFLCEGPVRVVYPVAHRKWLRWVDPATGEVSKPRKSPRTNDGHTLFRELYGLQDLALDPRITFSLVYLDVEEFKSLDGYGPDRKRRASRQDGIPTALVARMDLRSPHDYLVFLPDELGETFTVKDLSRAARIDERLAATTLQVMTRLGTTQHAGKQGRALVHTRNSGP